MQFCAAQIACVCLGAVAIGLLHKLGILGFRHDESFGIILVGTLCFQGATWLLIPLFAAASNRLARGVRFSWSEI